jgi:hypothetical protein
MGSFRLPPTLIPRKGDPRFQGLSLFPMAIQRTSEGVADGGGPRLVVAPLERLSVLSGLAHEVSKNRIYAVG